MRASRAGAPSIAAPPWPTKAERSNTSRGTPVRVSPALSPVRPGTGSAVPVYTASKRPKGVLPLGPRRRVTDRPCQSSSTLPSMAAPLQGW